MKKSLLILALACVANFSVQAQDTAAPAAPEAKAEAKGKAKHELTADQKALRAAMLEKYDANKDGKLDKEEIAKFSAEDKAKWDAAFPAHGKKKKKEGAGN